VCHLHITGYTVERGASMSAMLENWLFAFRRLVVGAIPDISDSSRSDESWSDRVTRERGWATEPRRVAGLEPTPDGGSHYVGSLSSSGSDCGGSGGGDCSGAGDSG
jgi:hypothetical protein